MKKISEINMVGPDETEIKPNTILYTLESKDMGNHYNNNWVGRGSIKVIPVRVITTNNSKRHFRTRTANGCEREYSLSDGCITGLYGDLKSAREAAQKLFDRDIECHQAFLLKAEKIRSSQKTLKTKRKLCMSLQPGPKPKKV